MSGGMRRKWRPRLWLVILLVLGLVLSLPFASLWLFRFYANQLVQQTEESLLMQAAILTAAYEQLYRDAEGLPPPPVPVERTEREFSPLFPRVTLTRTSVRPPRPDAQAAVEPIAGPYRDIAPLLSQMTMNAQEQTLAGYRILDRFGTVIAGSAETGVSLAHVEEVARALDGETVAMPRLRMRDRPDPLIYGLSQGSRVRIFVAMPAIVEEQLIGVVYLNRTPNHIFRFLHSERINLLWATVFILLSAGLIGFVFWRFISRPIHDLIERTDTFGQSHTEWVPLDHYGTKEIESLAGSFAAMGRRLQRQRKTLQTYTAHVSHEMKSPLTSIRGAAELLQNPDMAADQRVRFLANITQDIGRIEDLLARMREYGSVDQILIDGESALAQALEAVAARYPSVKMQRRCADMIVPLSQEALLIVLNQLVENAQAHGATTVEIYGGMQGDSIWVTISDNGSGISPGNRARIFDPFFTSRRKSGGTGMGLSIVRSVIEHSGGRISLEPTIEGAQFRIVF